MEIVHTGLKQAILLARYFSYHEILSSQLALFNQIKEQISHLGETAVNEN